MTKFYPSRIAKNDMRRVDVPEWKVKLLNNILNNHNYLVESHYCDNCDTIIYSDKAEKVPVFLFCSKFCEETFVAKQADDEKIIRINPHIKKLMKELKQIIQLVNKYQVDSEKGIDKIHKKFQIVKKKLDRKYGELKIRDINKEYPKFPHISIGRYYPDD